MICYFSKKLYLLVCVGIFLCLIIVGCSKEKNENSNQSKSDPPVAVEINEVERNDALKKAEEIMNNEFFLKCRKADKDLYFTLLGTDKKTLIELDNKKFEWKEGNLYPQDVRNNITYVSGIHFVSHNNTSRDKSEEWRMIRRYDKENHLWEKIKVPFDGDSQKKYNFPEIIFFRKINGILEFSLKDNNWVLSENFIFQKPSITCSEIQKSTISADNENILFPESVSVSENSNTNVAQNTSENNESSNNLDSTSKIEDSSETISVMVCPLSNLRATIDCPNKESKVFRKNLEPTDFCDFHRKPVSTPTPFVITEAIANETVTESISDFGYNFWSNFTQNYRNKLSTIYRAKNTTLDELVRFNRSSRSNGKIRVEGFFSTKIITPQKAVVEVKLGDTNTYTVTLIVVDNAVKVDDISPNLPLNYKN